MSVSPKPSDDDLRSTVAAILDENSVMTVATLRPDGWPQATLVGYVRDDLALYFVVARISQKFENIQHDPRVSIALGHHAPGRLRGLSMAARAVEVGDQAQIEHLNAIMRDRYPGQSRLSPREASSVVFLATPSIISIIDLAEGPGEPQLARVDGETTLHIIPNPALDRGAQSNPAQRQAAPGGAVHVRYVSSDAHVYRPGAPF